MFFFSTLLLSLYPVMGELMMSTWPPDIAPDPTCLPYDGSKVPDCSDYLGSRGDPVFIEHSFSKKLCGNKLGLDRATLVTFDC